MPTCGAKSSDQSTAGRTAARVLNASQLKRIEAFDPSKLGTADRIDYDVVLYQRRAAADVAKFDFGGSGYGPSPYVISQQSGAYQSCPTSSTPSSRSRPEKMPTHTFTNERVCERLDDETSRRSMTRRRRRAARLHPGPHHGADDRSASARGADDTVKSIARRAAAKGLGERRARGRRASGQAVLPALDAQLAEVTLRAGHSRRRNLAVQRRPGILCSALHNTTTTG